MSNDFDSTLLEFWDHFEELSTRLSNVVFVLVIVTVIVMSLPSDLNRIINLDLSESTPLVTQLMQYMQDTMLPEGVTLIAFNWLDSFTYT